MTKSIKKNMIGISNVREMKIIPNKWLLYFERVQPRQALTGDDDA